MDSQSQVPWFSHVPHHPGLSESPCYLWIWMQSYAIGHRSTNDDLWPKSSLLPFPFLFLSLF